MPARRILQLGDHLLRSVSTRIDAPPEAAEVLGDLRDTLHAFQREHGFGRGISAIQIGEPKRLIYLESGGVAYSLINPEYQSKSQDTFRLWDDCFSFPDLMVYLERACTVRIRYQDERGDWCELEASGAHSELIQHEMDHLDGILAVDRALDRNSLATRAEYLRHFATGPAARASNE